MTGPEYTAALTTLSLTPDQAAEWLGIGRSTAWRYLKEGAPGPVGRALMCALVMKGYGHTDQPSEGQFERPFYDALLDHASTALKDCKPFTINADGAYTLIQQALLDRMARRRIHSDLIAAVGLPG